MGQKKGSMCLFLETVFLEKKRPYSRTQDNKPNNKSFILHIFFFLSPSSSLRQSFLVGQVQAVSDRGALAGRVLELDHDGIIHFPGERGDPRPADRALKEVSEQDWNTDTRSF